MPLFCVHILPLLVFCIDCSVAGLFLSYVVAEHFSAAFALNAGNFHVRALARKRAFKPTLTSLNIFRQHFLRIFFVN